MTPRQLVAVDWGTTSLRGARLDANGRVMEERASAQGILNVRPGEFGAVFGSLFQDWMVSEPVLVLISGMAGSQQGWAEAPYCPCPAGFDEIARQLTWLEPGRMAIVPGISCEHPHGPDVMRGEEVQIFGALQLTRLRNGLFVLPGTHNKWAQVHDGRVTTFKTYMSGEVYALLSQHSILSKTLDSGATLDTPAFLEGVSLSQHEGGLLHHAFGTRTLGLFKRKTPGQLASYLSGLVIGDELRSQALAAGGEVVLVGSEALTARYALALAHIGTSTRKLGAEATWAGLHAIAKTLQI